MTDLTNQQAADYLLDSKYGDMVAALVKDGEEIRTSLTAEDCHLLHMAVGIAGEGGELLDCVLNAGDYANLDNFLSLFDRTNCAEELGDLHFYIVGAQQGVGVTNDWPKYEFSTSDPLRLAARISVLSNNVLDAVKKSVIYRKDLGTTDFDKQMSDLVDSIAQMFTLTGITRTEAQEANMSKLLTSDKARYKLGKYTDAQAQERADKDGEQG